MEEPSLGLGLDTAQNILCCSSPPRVSASQASQRASQYAARTALPFATAALSFRNVEYSVPLPPVRVGGLAGRLRAVPVVLYAGFQIKEASRWV